MEQNIERAKLWTTGSIITIPRTRFTPAGCTATCISKTSPATSSVKLLDEFFEGTYRQRIERIHLKSEKTGEETTMVWPGPLSD